MWDEHEPSNGTIDPRYGTNDDLKDLVKVAHNSQIRVLLDLVINHTGSQNPWFSGDASQRHDDWYIWENEDKCWNDPWEQSDNSSCGKTWFRDPQADLDRNHNNNAHDDDFFCCVFCDANGANMPDLNWKLALTQLESKQPSPLFDEVESIMKYWVTEVGVDGFCADAVRYLVENGKPSLNRDQPETHRVWQELRRRLSALSPSANLVAEAPTETYDQMRGYYGSLNTRNFKGPFTSSSTGI